MKVLVFDQQKDLPIDETKVKPIVHAVLSLENQSTDEVAVYFVTTEEISRLHGEFFNDPSPTDCISFPMDSESEGGSHVLGEIFVCPQTARDYLMKQSEEVTHDVYTETTLYVVHGILHLLGYDDIEEDDRVKMRAAEKRVMEHLIEKKRLLTA